MDQRLAQAIRKHIARVEDDVLAKAEVRREVGKATGALLGPETVGRIVRQEVAWRIREAGSVDRQGDLIALLIEAGVLAIDTAKAASLSAVDPIEAPTLLTESPPCQAYHRPAETGSGEAVPPLYAEPAEVPPTGFMGQFRARIFTSGPEAEQTLVAEVVGDINGRHSHAWTIDRLARQMAAAPELVALLGAVLPYARSRVETIELDLAADIDAPHGIGAAAEQKARAAQAAIDGADRLLERLRASTHPRNLKL